MINKIEAIRNLGIFREFRWNSEVPEFQKLNLFYGWNYSGKTTISRLFQMLEHKKLSSEYATAFFQVGVKEYPGIVSTDLSDSPVVKVYNRDHVNRHFTEEHSAPAVFIPEEENLTLKRRLAILEKRQDRIKKISRDLLARKQSIKTQVDQAGTEAARNIGNMLGDRNFRRPNLTQRVDEIKETVQDFLLPDDKVGSLLATIKSGGQYAELTLLVERAPNIASLANEVNSLLDQTASNRAIDRLKRNAEIESWVRQGLSIHTKAKACEFCGSAITDARLEELGEHFSEEYEILIESLKRKTSYIEGLDFNFPIQDEMRLLPDLRPAFLAAKSKILDWCDWASTVREQLAETLRNKQTSIENRTPWAGDLSRAPERQNILRDLNATISGHNEIVLNMGSAKAQAKTDLERHYAAQYYLDLNISAKEAEIRVLDRKINRIGEIEADIAQRVGSIKAKIQPSSIGAVKLNQLLKYLLADSNIEVVSIDNTEFQFRRGNHIATHLSEGEKTAVSFAYFVTSLEAHGAAIADEIIFVDDPISSLDSNHIYAVYALIVERLEACKQLFVSTHNAELFNLLKSQWLGKNGGNRDYSRAYHVWRSIDENGDLSSTINDLPMLLRKYKSEYEFIFSQLYQFSLTEVPSQHEIYTSPNLLRKFLEAYLGFRKPSVRKWSEKLDVLFDSSEQVREVQKFSDDLSHLQALGRSLQNPEFASAAKRCVKMVLDALKSKDQSHFDSLVEISAGVNP